MTGLMDAAIQIVIILVFAVATRAFWRRANEARGPRHVSHAERQRRPWER